MKRIVMKKVLVYSSIVLMLLAGCSSKSPSIDETKGSTATSGAVENAADADTVVVDENGGVSSTGGAVESGEETMSSLEKQMQTIYFAFDKYDISTEASESLQANAALAKDKAAAFNIKIEGNCDEWGSDEYNFALGLKRAKTAKDSLVAEGVDAGRITMVSYGESNPICVEKSKECWAKNRRDDFKLLP
jgi:peptidoglycan-associated lipoprotein